MNAPVECRLCGTTFKNFNVRSDTVRCPNCGSQSQRQPTQSHIINRYPQPRPAPVKSLPKYSHPEKKPIQPTLEVKTTGFKEAYDKADIVGRFQCVSCLNYFEFNMGAGSPSCPKCGEIELIKITSPLARVVSCEDQAPLSLADVKKYRFIIRNWKKYKLIEQQMDGLKGLLQTSGLEESLIKKLNSACESALVELDREHSRKIDEYMQRRKV